MSDPELVESMRRFYDAIGRRRPDLPFLNYGYLDDPQDNQPVDLVASCRRLYARALSPFPDRVSDVLEVGCGRGAGAEGLLREHPNVRYVGLDLSTEHLVLSRERLGRRPKTSFALADAARLPIASQSVDAVFSIEAVQHFQGPVRFYHEAARVLRRGGSLLVASLWAPGHEPDRLLFEAGLRVTRVQDITANVVASLDRTSDTREALVDGLQLPARFRPLLLSWAGVRGSASYEHLAQGALRYLSYHAERLDQIRFVPGVVTRLDSSPRA